MSRLATADPDGEEEGETCASVSVADLLLRPRVFFSVVTKQHGGVALTPR